MRIVEPRQFNHLKTKKTASNKKVLSLFLAVIVAGGLYYGWSHPPKIKRSVQPAPMIEQEAIPEQAQEPARPKVIKAFSGDDFKRLFRSLAHPNTQVFIDPPDITGNEQADRRIRQLAEERGYRMTSIPVHALVRTQEDATANSDDLLQPLAYQGWISLKEAALKEGIPLVLYSGYRSPEFQRDIFLERLLINGATPERIAAGQADAAVRATLEMTAVPGYSRHHSGYTADFRCDDGSANFGSSKCFTWLNEDNYRRSKEHGWIPSYPEEAEEQGPEPEPWEYIWVGRDALSE